MIATTFSAATHILLLMTDDQQKHFQHTSLTLATILETNPVVVRRILGSLARAGLIETRRGAGGSRLAKPVNSITLNDIWVALHDNDRKPLLTLHRGLGTDGSSDPVHNAIAKAFKGIEAEFRSTLMELTLGEMAKIDFRKAA